MQSMSLEYPKPVKEAYRQMGDSTAAIIQKVDGCLYEACRGNVTKPKTSHVVEDA